MEACTPDGLFAGRVHRRCTQDPGSVCMSLIVILIHILCLYLVKLQSWVPL